MNEELYRKGLSIRRNVLGAEYVDKSIAAADDFTGPLQEFVTEYCWGATWGSDKLCLKIRSIINIAMLSALNRGNEFKLHVRGALNNGVTKGEIAEILLQVGVYCGVPAAVESFRLAQEVFAERDIR